MWVNKSEKHSFYLITLQEAMGFPSRIDEIAFIASISSLYSIRGKLWM